MSEKSDELNENSGQGELDSYSTLMMILAFLGFIPLNVSLSLSGSHPHPHAHYVSSAKIK